jgi:hypothetical protein
MATKMKIKKYRDGGEGKESSKTRTGLGGRTIVKSKLSYADDYGNYDRKTREVTTKDGTEKLRTKRTSRPVGEKPETIVIKAKNADTKSRSGIVPVKKGIMKTGGMVNSNAKVSASKVARGRVGGTSSAPKTAVPKAKMGMSMKRKSC